jgi:plasmid maintenance system antidote protein VapI
MLREALEARGWSKAELAWTLGYSTLFVESLLAEPCFTPEIALRLEAGLGVRAEAWLDCQRDHELWHLRERMGGEMAMIQRRAVRASSLRD